MPHRTCRPTGSPRLWAQLAVCLALVGCGPSERRPVAGPDAMLARSDAKSLVVLPAVDGVGLELVGEFMAPVAIAFRANDANPYLAERGGRILRLGPSGPARLFDLTNRVGSLGEQGLFSIAISPNGRHLYAAYAGKDADFHLEEFVLDGERPDRGREVLVIEQTYVYHYGGSPAFGPDGYLYVGVGSGGAPDREADPSQDLGSLHGKLLRFDPAEQLDGAPRAAPPDNPHVGRPEARPEIWLSGVRNPWRFSFDRSNGDLWIGDVGEREVEEVNHLPAITNLVGGRGANLGWDIREGDQPRRRPDSVAGLVEPLHTYRHSQGCAVVGGFRYRGRAVTQLAGSYVFADLCEPGLRILDPASPRSPRRLGVPVRDIVSFAEDHEGELYVISLSGQVHRIVPG